MQDDHYMPVISTIGKQIVGLYDHSIPAATQYTYY